MPVVATVVVVSLGVGIGVNTAVFSWVQAMYLQPIPGVAGAARCISSSRGPNRVVSGRLLARIPRSEAAAVRRCPSCSPTAWWRSTSGERGHDRTDLRPVRLGQLLLGAGSVAGAWPLPPAGRRSDAREASRSSIVSYDYWQTRFNGSPEASGPHDPGERAAAHRHRRGATTGFRARS